MTDITTLQEARKFWKKITEIEKKFNMQYNSEHEQIDVIDTKGEVIQSIDILEVAQ